MKVAVVGAGSVGIGVAASLSIGGAEIAIIARQTAQKLREQNIIITGVLGNYTINSFAVGQCPGLSPDTNTKFKSLISDCDVVVVATKAYDIIPALQPLVQIIEQRATPPVFLLLQNGWGSAEEAKQLLPTGTAIFSGRVITGFERRLSSHVNITAHGDAVRVGSLFGDDPAKIKPFINIAQKGFLPFVYNAEIETVLLQKLLFNLCLNPLGALMQCAYGELIANKYTEALMHELAEEAIITIVASRGLKLYSGGSDYVQNDLIPNRIPRTAAHRSSMLQDINAGRKTEIDYLNGAISKMGAAHNIATPHNNTIVSLIQALESLRKPLSQPMSDCPSPARSPTALPG